MNFTTISIDESKLSKEAREALAGEARIREELANVDKASRELTERREPPQQQLAQLDAAHKKAAVAAARDGAEPPPAPDRAELVAEIDRIEASRKAIGGEAQKLSRELERFRARAFPGLAEVAELLTTEALAAEAEARAAYERYLAAARQAEVGWSGLVGDHNRHRHTPGERINGIPPSDRTPPSKLFSGQPIRPRQLEPVEEAAA